MRSSGSKEADKPSEQPQRGEQAQSQSVVQSPSQADIRAGQFDFVTFDLGRKHLARVVAVNGKKITVRRFDKKSGEWRIGNESRDREACIPLTAAEAEASFPGCVADWDNAAQSAAGSGGKVTRQISPNLAAPLVAAPAFQSVADFVSAYSDKKKTIDSLTGNFIDKVGLAKQAQDDLVPHLAAMQSLLSKKGANHHLVIEARKQGHKILWWTDFYKGYKDRLWESLRTMERRIAAYRSDPTASISKPERDTDPIPRLNKADRKALIVGNHRANELVAALDAGRDGKTETASFKAVMDANRLDDIMQAHEQEPDYRVILSKVLQAVADMKASLPAAFTEHVRELTKSCKFKIARRRQHSKQAAVKASRAKRFSKAWQAALDKFQKREGAAANDAKKLAAELGYAELEVEQIVHRLFRDYVAAVVQHHRRRASPISIKNSP